MPRREITFAVTICLVGAGLACADSINDTWLGGTGIWSDPAGWSAGSPNNAGSTTYAPMVGSGGTDQVTLDTSFTIDSLAIGGSTGGSVVQSGSGSLNLLVLGALSVGQTGSLSLSNGDVLTVGGNATSAGSIGVSSGASLGITGDLTTTPASRFSALVVGGSGILNVGGTLNNQSTLEVGGTANLNMLNNTGVVTIDGGGTLNLTGGGAGITDIAAGANYSVSGAFNVINGGVPGYALANLASVEGGLLLQNGQTTTLSSLTNSGGLSVGGPGTALTVTGDLTNVSVSRFSAIVVGGGSSLNVGGTLNNQSTLEVGGTANLNMLNNTGVVTIDGGGTLNLTGGGAGITDIAAGASYSVSGAFNVINGGVPGYALANLASVEGGLLLQNGQTTTLSSLTNSGGLSLGGPGTALTVTGNLTNTQVSRFSAIVVAGGSTLNVGGTLNNQSTLDVDGGMANVNVLNNTGVVTIEAGGEACIGSLNNDGILNLDGSLNGPGCGAQTDFTLAEIITSANNFGVFNYSGPVTLGGTLDVELEDGFIPTAGESFDFINFPAGDLAGAFGKITNDFFNNNTEQWGLTYDNADGDVILTAEAAQSAPEPSTSLLLGGGLTTLCLYRTRRRSKSEESRSNPSMPG